MSQRWWFSLGVQSQFYTRLELKAGINDNLFINESKFQDHLPLSTSLFDSLPSLSICLHTLRTWHSSLTSHVTKITPVLLFIWQWLSLIFLWITSKLMKICNHQFDIKIQLSLFNSNTVIIEMREIICNVFVYKRLGIIVTLYQGRIRFEII